MEMALVGISRALREIDEDISLLAPLDTKVLITGERGVGKDLVARLVHQRSLRTGPFVTINCAVISDTVLESELFGMSVNTGTSQSTRDWLEQAKGGTIFFNNVGEMSLAMQALLLQFLEDNEIRRMGSRGAATAGRVRVISATSHDLLERVVTGDFREDLYYRMNVIHLVIPPLRERPEDVIPLVAHFGDKWSAAYHVPKPVLTVGALAKLTAYSWPGNVRELESVMKRLLLQRERLSRGTRGPADGDPLRTRLARIARDPDSQLNARGRLRN